jgi:hypothetical protein
MMTREEELKVLAEYLKTTGATKLPPDERGPHTVWSVWKKPPPKKRGRKPKPKPQIK